MASEAASITPSPATAPNTLPRATLALANVRYEKKGSIAYVTVNRPKVLNALNTPTWTDLHSAFEDAKADASVHGVILTGALGVAPRPPRSACSSSVRKRSTSAKPLLLSR